MEANSGGLLYQGRVIISGNMEAIPGGSGKVIILPPYCLYSTTDE